MGCLRTIKGSPSRRSDWSRWRSSSRRRCCNRWSDISPTKRRSHSRSRSAWDSPSLACCCSASRSNTSSSSSRRHWWGWARRCFTRNRRGLRASPRAGASALTNRCFLLAPACGPRCVRFLAANAAGAFFGGPLGDRFGRKYVIWFSILGALPFTLALPYVGLFTGAVLTVFIGLILSSATSSIIVFAQELMPHRFGMISGMFFGVAFGIGGLGAAVLGKVADHTGIAFVYQV